MELSESKAQMDKIDIDIELDCLGMLCPLPIVKTQKMINTMDEGQVLKMLSTDGASPLDVKAWSLRTGHELLLTAESAGIYTFLIRKSGAG